MPALGQTLQLHRFVALLYTNNSWYSDLHLEYFLRTSCYMRITQCMPMSDMELLTRTVLYLQCSDAGKYF